MIIAFSVNAISCILLIATLSRGGTEIPVLVSVILGAIVSYLSDSYYIGSILEILLCIMILFVKYKFESSSTLALLRAVLLSFLADAPSEAKKVGNSLLIPYSYLGTRYEVHIPYGGAVSTSRKVKSSRRGKETVYNYQPGVPLLVTSKDIGVTTLIEEKE